MRVTLYMRVINTLRADIPAGALATLRVVQRPHGLLQSPTTTLFDLFSEVSDVLKNVQFLENSNLIYRGKSDLQTSYAGPRLGQAEQVSNCAAKQLHSQFSSQRLTPPPPSMPLITLIIITRPISLPLSSAPLGNLSN